MSPNKSSFVVKQRRREFVKASAVAAALAMPAVATASKTASELVIGDGEHTYRVHHHWPQLPDKYHWQTTHNVAFDSAGNLYVIHEGQENLKDHPSIFVFDATGKFVRAFGQQFQGGGHGIEVRLEGNQEFLYVAAYQQVKKLRKVDSYWRSCLAAICANGIWEICGRRSRSSGQGLGARPFHAN